MFFANPQQEGRYRVFSSQLGVILEELERNETSNRYYSQALLFTKIAFVNKYK